jgi:ABC-type nitrate/sulfonate/bicarbonate transport system ATPase subunit
MYMQDELLRIWKERRNTLILVTHDVEEAIYLSDRIALFSPRPGCVTQIIQVSLPRPRSRNDTNFAKIRARLSEALGLIKS